MNELLHNPDFWTGMIFSAIFIALVVGIQLVVSYVGSRLGLRHELRDYEQQRSGRRRW